MAFCFKNIFKDIILTDEDDDDYENNICRFCEKEILSDKVRDHCSLTVKYRGPARNTCNIDIILLLKIKVILYHLYFVFLVTMIVICF